MDDRVARLESAVAVLTERVKDLERRVQGVEGGWTGAPDDVQPPLAASSVDMFERAPVQQWLGLAGRIFLVLGGAYLLRALTDSHVVPAHIGVALGLLYGAPWLALAARAGARGAQLDAFCHALATALIGYPLVWEATVRFGVIGSGESAVLLGLLTAAALLLAAVAHLEVLAWVVTAGALGSAVTLAMATRDWNSYTLLAVAMGIGTLWLAYLRNWGVCWLAAAGLDFMLVIATGRAAVSSVIQGTLALQFLTFTGYVGSAAARSLSGRHRIMAFEIVQSVAAVVLAVGGSLLLLRTSSGALVVGAAALAVGALAYGAAFGLPQVRSNMVTSFFWSIFALVLASIGAAVCFGASIASVLYAVAAAATAVVARRQRSLTLNLHASVYALSATIGSGLLGVGTVALVRPPSTGWSLPDPAALIALMSLALLVRTPVVTDRTLAGSIPRAIVMSALVWTSMGLAVLLAGHAVGDPLRIDASVLATLRTAVLVLTTLVLARVERYESGREAAWLMYPLLTVTGLKLVFFDLPLGTPQTLFAALALYGFALIAAPRMARTAAPAGRGEFVRTA